MRLEVLAKRRSVNDHGALVIRNPIADYVQLREEVFPDRPQA